MLVPSYMNELVVDSVGLPLPVLSMEWMSLFDTNMEVFVALPPMLIGLELSCRWRGASYRNMLN